MNTFKVGDTWITFGKGGEVHTGTTKAESKAAADAARGQR